MAVRGNREFEQVQQRHTHQSVEHRNASNFQLGVVKRVRQQHVVDPRECPKRKERHKGRAYEGKHDVFYWTAGALACAPIQVRVVEQKISKRNEPKDHREANRSGVAVRRDHLKHERTDQRNPNEPKLECLQH